MRLLRLGMMAIFWAGANAAAHGQTSSPVSQWLLFNSCSTQHTYKIATLPESADGTYDHLHMTATLSPNWYSVFDTEIDATFANRGGFTALFTANGANPSGTTAAHLVAYQNPTDGQSNDGQGSVDLYMVYTGCAYASYAILENVQETVYSTPNDLGSATPSGTLVFDTATTPSASFTDFSGNLNVSGQIHASGSVGIGTSTPGAPLEVNGNIKFTAIPIAPGSTTTTGGSLIFGDGTIQSTAYTGTCVAAGGDYAEAVDVTGETTSYEPGDIMVIDPDRPGHFALSSEPYSTRVTGIYSTKPGYVGRRQAGGPKLATTEIPMAMIGVVPTKVTAENGPIRAGDLLVTSSRPGYAMKGTDRAQMTGAIVGKALASLSSGTGVIEVVVTLQ